jgi:phage terminase small subunit
MGPLTNQRYERFAEALAQGKTATEAYVLAGYKANDGNATRLKGNERILARVQEIVGRAAERAEVSLERTLRELAAIAFSNITKAVTWGPSVQVREEKDEGGQRVKVVTGAVSLVSRDELDENTAAAIAAVSQSSTRALSVRMHDKLAALIAPGKHLGIFDHRTQKTNVVYSISDKPMSDEEWSKRYATPH